MGVRKLVAVTGACCGVLGLTWAVSSPHQPGYKSWNLVTPKPLDMDPTIAAMCAQPKNLVTGYPVHYLPGKRFYRVYVNPTGAHSLREGITFPEGSTIVKEKLFKEANTFDVELLTVMTKGRKGSNPTAGDWDFYVAKRDGTRVRRDVSKCVSCHQSEKNTDMVFRTYIMGGPARR